MFENFPISNEELDPVKSFVSSSLLQKLNGGQRAITHQYDLIVKQLRVKDDQETLWKVLLCLCSCTSIFTERSDIFSELLEALFAYDWKCEQKVSLAFTSLIIHIVSTNAVFIVPSFRCLVRSLLPALTTSLSLESVDESIISRHKCIHHAIQNIILSAPTGQTALFPILLDTFPHKRFSRNVQTEYISQLLLICDYVPLLQQKILDLIISKCLEIDVEIVIEESGDVRIQLDDDNYNEDNDDQMLFQFDTQDKPVNHDNNNKNSNSKFLKFNDSSSRIPLEVVEMADKLDSMLYLVVKYIDSQHEKGSEQANRIFQQLIDIFYNRILQTYKSKFVQFCIFSLTMKNHNYCEIFSKNLLDIGLSHKNSNNKRLCAIMYLASFLSRANFLDVKFVSNMIGQIICWAENYIIRSGGGRDLQVFKPPIAPNATKNNNSNTLINQINESEINYDQYSFHYQDEYDEYGRKTVNAIDNHLSRHEVFYAVVQAACYILCFYGVNIANIHCSSQVWRQAWAIIVMSYYDPLRYCLKSVRVEFIKLALTVDLFDDTCWNYLSIDLFDLNDYISTQPSEAIPEAVPVTDILPVLGSDGVNPHPANDLTKNNLLISRIQLKKSQQSSGSRSTNQPKTQNNHFIRLGLGVNPLDSFFPFDPCLLRLIHDNIQAGYRCWKGLPGVDFIENNNQVPGHDTDLDEENNDDDLDMEKIDDLCSSLASSMMDTNNNYNITKKYNNNIMNNNYNNNKSGGGAVMAMSGTSLSSSYGGYNDHHSHQDEDDEIHDENNNNNCSMNMGMSTGMEAENNEGAMDAIMPQRRARRYSIGSVGSW
eukprot:gene4481-6332_t